MNKGLLYGIGGIVVAGIGFGIYKFINKKSEEPVEEVKENTQEIVTEENKDNDFLNKMMEEEKEAEEATKNWTEREERCRKEMAEKASLKDQDIFEDKVTDSKEFEALNELRKAAGKEPLKVDEKFSQFLGKDSEKSMKESLDSIAENVKKDPKFKKKILDILSE